MCKIVITGGRDFNDMKYLSLILNAVHQRFTITQLTHGNARGADKMSGSWALSHQIPVVIFNADWNRYGSRAGPIRNQKMIDTQPDFVVAFPGGTGTNGCVRLAEKAGLRILDFRSGNDDPAYIERRFAKYGEIRIDPS